MTRLGGLRRFYTSPVGTVVHQDPLCGYLSHSRSLRCWTAEEVAERDMRPCSVCKPTLILHPSRG